MAAMAALYTCGLSPQQGSADVAEESSTDACSSPVWAPKPMTISHGGKQRGHGTPPWWW